MLRFIREWLAVRRQRRITRVANLLASSLIGLAALPAEQRTVQILKLKTWVDGHPRRDEIRDFVRYMHQECQRVLGPASPA